VGLREEERGRGEGGGGTKDDGGSVGSRGREHTTWGWNRKDKILGLGVVWETQIKRAKGEDDQHENVLVWFKLKK